ncbi:hypothetical protein D3C75_685810 [compost metagenome]
MLRTFQRRGDPDVMVELPFFFHPSPGEVRRCADDPRRIEIGQLLQLGNHLHVQALRHGGNLRIHTAELNGNPLLQPDNTKSLFFLDTVIHFTASSDGQLKSHPGEGLQGRSTRPCFRWSHSMKKLKRLRERIR